MSKMTSPAKLGLTFKTWLSLPTPLEVWSVYA